MLKIISSKNESLIWNEISKQKQKLGFQVPVQSKSLREVIAGVGDVSIFGEKEVIAVNISNPELGSLIEDDFNLKIFLDNTNLYFFFGSGVEFDKTFSKEKTNFIKLEEKKVFDFPTGLVNALQKGDKKNSWNLLLKELRGKDAEPVHGVCVFAYKSVLVYLNDPKENSKDSGVKEFPWNNAKRNVIAVKRDRNEVVNKYFDLVVHYHKARSGEGDLAKQLELWVLK